MTRLVYFYVIDIIIPLTTHILVIEEKLPLIPKSLPQFGENEPEIQRCGVRTVSD